MYLLLPLCPARNFQCTFIGSQKLVNPILTFYHFSILRCNWFRLLINNFLIHFSSNFLNLLHICLH
jgi:hypothetical protein